jgi:hypothetical protein
VALAATGLVSREALAVSLDLPGLKIFTLNFHLKFSPQNLNDSQKPPKIQVRSAP